MNNDLISRDYALAQIQKAKENGYEFNYDTLTDFIKVLPTIQPSGDLISKAEAIKIWQNLDYIKTSSQLKNAKEMLDLVPTIPPTEPRWIPVSERLPEKDGSYLVTKETDLYTRVEVDIANWFAIEKANNGFHKADRVIAWQPLPEPYKAEPRKENE